MYFFIFTIYGTSQIEPPPHQTHFFIILSERVDEGVALFEDVPYIVNMKKYIAKFFLIFANFLAVKCGLENGMARGETKNSVADHDV